MGDAEALSIFIFWEKRKMVEENAIVGEEKNTALDKEYVLLEKYGIEVYVDTNMELHARLKR